MTDNPSHADIERSLEVAWWQSRGNRLDGGYFGILENGFLRQSKEEAARWAEDRCLTASKLGLTQEDIDAISTYSDGKAYGRINANFYRRRETRINDRLRTALRKGVIPDGIVVWRGAGYKLYRYPVSGPRLIGNDPSRAVGRVFKHWPPISTSVGNGAAEIGLRQDVQYRLQIEPGVRGVFIPEISVKGYLEEELLLAPGTSIRIEQAEKRGEKWYVLATALANRGVVNRTC